MHVIKVILMYFLDCLKKGLVDNRVDCIELIKRDFTMFTTSEEFKNDLNVTIMPQLKSKGITFEMHEERAMSMQEIQMFITKLHMKERAQFVGTEESWKEYVGERVKQFQSEELFNILEFKAQSRLMEGKK
jgi:translation elongation factor EF-1alpha